MMTEDGKEELVTHFNRAWPLGGDFITRTELSLAMNHVEIRLQAAQSELSLKIKASELVQRNWILTGVIAILVTFGGGYFSLVSKLDRVTITVPELQVTIRARRDWMLRQEHKNDRQDRALQDLKPGYEPLPFESVPN